MNDKVRKLLFFIGSLLVMLAIVWVTHATRTVNFRAPWYFNIWAQHLLSALGGVIVGAFFSQKMRKFRRGIIIALVVLGALAAFLENVYIGNIISFIVGAAVAYSLLREAIRAFRKRKKKPTTFGSAEWADLEHLQDNNLIGKKGFSLGVFSKDGISHPIHYTGDRHLLTVAPTRAGKGVSAIIPNLLTYEGSAIIIDPKGENAKITAPRRGKGDQALNISGMGQRVHVIDPWGITGLPCSCFNPLDWLRPNDPDINENAMMLADSIIVPSESTGDSKFWDEEAKALLMGFLLHVALDESEQKSRSLGRVRDIICMGTGRQNDIFDIMEESPNPIVRSTAARTTSKEEKLRSNVIASLQAHTHFLDSPRIRASLKKSDFRFEDLKTSKMTVYLVLPADRLETFGRWLRLLVQQALTVNARNIEIKPDKPILFLLDEMAALGRLTMVEQAYSLMAGFGMQLWGIIQDLSQLDRIYDKGWETFIGNSGVLQYFGSRDHKTAEYFSKLCGVTTVEKESIAKSIASALGRSWSSSSTSSQQGGSSTSGSGGSDTETFSDTTTTDVVQRHLAFPDELMVMRENKELVLIENFNPIPARKVLWHKDETLRPLGVDLHKKPVAPAAITAGKAPPAPADIEASPAPAAVEQEQLTALIPAAIMNPALIKFKTKLSEKVVAVFLGLRRRIDAVKTALDPAAAKHQADPAPAAIENLDLIELKTETYEKAKKAAPGLDVYGLEQKWRKWIAKKGEPLKNPDAAFIAFCRKADHIAINKKTPNKDENFKL